MGTETKEKISKALSGKPAKEIRHKRKHTLICKECFSQFTSTRKEKMYCSHICLSKNSGGYRPGSGRSKSGYYNGIYCGSTYELAWVIHAIDNNIKFNRFPGYIQYNDIKYYPDFIIDNTIIELKGFEDSTKVDAKSDVARIHGYDIIVLRKDDLIEQFEWVKNHYAYTNMWELYDDYRPSFTMTCTNCNVQFGRDRAAKTIEKFCSRKCAGTYRKSVASLPGDDPGLPP